MNRRNRVTLICLVLSVVASSAALAAPPIRWEPHRLEVEIGSGILEPVEVTFHASQALDDLTVEVVPELEPFLSVQNPTIPTIERGGEHTVRLSPYIPPETPEGVYEGVLRLRRGRRTLARPLPVVVTVDYGGAVIAPGTRVLSREAAGKLVEVSPDGRILSFEGSGRSPRPTSSSCPRAMFCPAAFWVGSSRSPKTTVASSWSLNPQH